MTRKAVTMELKGMSKSSFFLNINVKLQKLKAAGCLTILAAIGIGSLGCQPWASPMEVETTSKASSSLVERVTAGPVATNRVAAFS